MPTKVELAQHSFICESKEVIKTVLHNFPKKASTIEINSDGEA